MDTGFRRGDGGGAWAAKLTPGTTRGSPSGDKCPAPSPPLIPAHAGNQMGQTRRSVPQSLDPRVHCAARRGRLPPPVCPTSPTRPAGSPASPLPGGERGRIWHRWCWFGTRRECTAEQSSRIYPPSRITPYTPRHPGSRGAPSGGGPSVERGVALHVGFAGRHGEARARTDVTTDVCLQGLNRPLRGSGKSAEPGSSKPPRRAPATRLPFGLPDPARCRRPPPPGVSPPGTRDHQHPAENTAREREPAPERVSAGHGGNRGDDRSDAAPRRFSFC